MSEARSEKEYSQIENTLSYIFGCNKGCKSRNLLIYTLVCGERGIRTPGTSRYDGFQDRCNRPLYHLSIKGTVKHSCFLVKSGAKVGIILENVKFETGVLRIKTLFNHFVMKNVSLSHSVD